MRYSFHQLTDIYISRIHITFYLYKTFVKNIHLILFQIFSISFTHTHTVPIRLSNGHRAWIFICRFDRPNMRLMKIMIGNKSWFSISTWPHAHVTICQFWLIGLLNHVSMYGCQIGPLMPYFQREYENGLFQSVFNFIRISIDYPRCRQCQMFVFVQWFLVKLMLFSFFARQSTFQLINIPPKRSSQCYCTSPNTLLNHCKINDPRFRLCLDFFALIKKLYRLSCEIDCAQSDDQ